MLLFTSNGHGAPISFRFISFGQSMLNGIQQPFWILSRLYLWFAHKFEVNERVSEWVKERAHRVLKTIWKKFYFGRNNKCRSIQPSPTFRLLYSSLVITTTKRISKRIRHTINIVFISISIAIFLFPHSLSFSLLGAGMFRTCTLYNIYAHIHPIYLSFSLFDVKFMFCLG